MTVTKITNDDSVRYIPQSGQTKQRDIKPNTIKKSSVPREQNKNFSQKDKK